MKQKSSLYKLMGLLKEQSLLYAAAIGALAAAVASETAGNLIIKTIVDDFILGGKPLKILFFMVLIYFSTALLRAGFSFIEGRGRGASAERLVRRIRENLFDHLQKVSFKYHDENQTGELIQRATSDVDAVRRFYSEQIPGLSRVVLLYLINLGALLFLDVKLTLITTLITPFIAGISIFFFNKIFKAYDSHQEQEGIMTSRVQENLSGIRIVRAFARQEWENQKFDEINSEMYKRGRKLLFWHALYWPASHTICGLQFTLTLLLGALAVINGSMTPGTYIAFVSMVNALIWPMQELGRMITELSKSFVSFNRIEEILETDQEDIKTGKTPDERLSGEITFENISFSYVKGTPVLENINFHCPAGNKIAVIGETGSGKTTLVNLIPRFYEYTEGRILFGDKELKEFNRHFLRLNIGIVEQEPFLFSTTIRDNITLGTERKVSDEEIYAAAKAAAVHDSIMSFPEGYETLVGEKGVSLSGGQKQRIALARVLLKNPSILILDDSTSAVDSETEESIRNALNKIMKGRTTFIIAHRVQTLKEADTILVMKKGQIIQSGSHDELIHKNGFYKDVFELQTQMENELAKELNASA